jgi:hypothetical protein
VQGKLRKEQVTVRVETGCVHCAKTMEMEIDSDLHVKPFDENCEPVIFVPDVDLLNLQEDSIIDSF